MTAPAQAQGPVDLADRLDAIAATQELTLHTAELRRLAHSVRTGDGLAEWAGIDLVGTFAHADLLSEPHTDRDGGNRHLTAWSVLAFVPVMITWFGLVMATNAYQRLLARPDAEERIGSKSFLQLWQQGFDGELWGPFHFSWIGGYTLVALITMVILMLWATRRARVQEERRGKARQALLGELVPRLIQAQWAAASSSLASPARFGAELSRAAGELRELIGQSIAAHNDLRAHGAQTRQLTEILDAAVTRMNQTCTELSAATAAAKSAAETGRAAAASIERALTKHVTSANAEIQRAGQAAQERMNRAAAASAAATEDAVQGHRDAFDAAAARLADAAGTVQLACDRLTGAGPQLAADLATAGRQAATTIGEVYQLAVAEAARSLRQEMTAIGSDLVERIEDFQAVAEQLRNHVRSAADDHGSVLTELIGSADALRLAMDARTTETGCDPTRAPIAGLVTPQPPSDSDEVRL